MRKKFYLVLFLFALLGTAGAWATRVQVTYSVTKSAGTWFWPDGNPVDGTSGWATKFVSSDNVLTLESTERKINSGYAFDNGFRINHGDLGLAIVSYTLSVPQNFTIVNYTFGAAPSGGADNIMKISPNEDMSGAVSVRKTPVEGESQASYTQEVNAKEGTFYLQQPAGAVDVTLTVVVEADDYGQFVRSYLTEEKIANVECAGQYGYPKKTTPSYENITSFVDKLTQENAEWTEEEYANVASYYEAYLAETDIVLPEAGKFYRIYCDNGTNIKYITEKNGEIWGLVAPEYEYKATIWYMDENKLTALSNGYQYAGSSSNSAAMGLTNTAVSFQKSTSTFGKMNVVPTGVSSWFVQISTTNEGKLGTGGDNLPGARFNVEEVDALPITISDAGLATFYSPVAVTVPEGVTAYTGEINENGTALNLNPVRAGGTIPANTAVILEKTDGGKGEREVSLPIAKDASVAGTENEVFTGTISTITTPTDAQIKILTLQSRDGNTGFYPYSGETLAGFKAYLTMTNDSNDPAGVKGIVLNFGMTDAIREIVKDGQQAEAIYDLTGRRVEKAVKGIYIVNGKKTVIK